MSDFLLGVVLGVIVGWLTDWLLFRRQMQGEADALRAELQAAQGQAKDLERKVEAHGFEVSELRDRLGTAQGSLSAYEGVSVQYDNAQAEIEALRAQLAEYESTRGQLAVTTVEIEELRGQLALAEGNLAEYDGMSAQYDNAQSEIAALRAQLADCESTRSQLEESTTEIEELRTRLAHLTVAPQPIESPAIVPDNLQRIEGIGPKISQVLMAAGIMTFGQLASSQVDALRAILDQANMSRINNPETWPAQAALAARGAWDDLAAMQEDLKGGRRIE